MALTQISTDGVKDDAVTAGKIPANAVGSSEIAANAVGSSELADNAVDTAAIADDAVTFAKLENVDQNHIVGRVSSGTGNAQELNAGEVRTLLNVADGATNSPTITINTNADNRIITGSGTANTLNGEASLTYDSGGMAITGDTDRDGLKITQSGNNYGEFMFNSNRSGSSSALGVIRGEWNSTEVASIYLTTGSDTTNKDDGQIRFFTSPDSGTGIQTRMLIDSSGKVSVGSETPIYNFNVRGSGQQTILIGSTNAGGAYLTLDGDSNGDGQSGDYCHIGHTSAGDLELSADNPNGTAGMIFKAGNAAEKMRIDANGNVGIGTTSPSSFNADGRNLVVGTGSGGQGLSIYSANNNYGNIYFADGTSDGSYNAGGILYNHSSNFMRFDTAAGERMRIDSSGRLLLNSTSTSIASKLISTIGTGTGVTWGQCGLAVTHASGANTKSLIGFGFSGNGGSYPPAAIGSFTNSTSGNENNNLVFFTRSATSDTEASERMRIDSSGIVTKPQQPSFAAYSTGAWTHGSDTGTLNIDTITTEAFDVGGNYNHSTGIFTAPVAGKYFFSLTFMYICTSGYLNIYLKKGVSGTYSEYARMMSSPPQQSSNYSNASGISGIIDLAAQNTVRPQAEVNYAGNQIWNLNFSGYLIG